MANTKLNGLESWFDYFNENVKVNTTNTVNTTTPTTNTYQVGTTTHIAPLTGISVAPPNSYLVGNGLGSYYWADDNKLTFTDQYSSINSSVYNTLSFFINGKTEYLTRDQIEKMLSLFMKIEKMAKESETIADIWNELQVVMKLSEKD